MLNITTARLLLICSFFGFFLPVPILCAEENIDYRFKRMWPRLEQPWYFNQPADVAVAANGNIYVADSSNDRIMLFDSNGVYLRQWGVRGSATGQFFRPNDIAISPDGSVYVADSNNYRIQQFSAEGEYIRQWGSKGSGAGEFLLPSGIAISATGNVYVTDQNNHRVQHFTAEGLFVRQWGSKGAEMGQFDGPNGIAISADGNVYVTDENNFRIQQFTAEGVFVRQWGSEGSGESQFNLLYAIAIAENGNVYVTDSRQHRIQQFNAKGEFIRQWGSLGFEQNQLIAPRGIAIGPQGKVYVAGNIPVIQKFSAEGQFIRRWTSLGSDEGQFNDPSALAFAPNGSLYVADYHNHRIQQFSSEGQFIHQWGNDISVINGRLAQPSAIAIAPNGNVFVAESNNARWQQFSSDGQFIRKWTFAGRPSGIAVAPNGSIYVTDSDNHRIQHFTAEGLLINQWGAKGAEVGQFNFPSGIAVASNGNVYVVDISNHRIQQFTAEGTFINTWGSRGSGEGQFQNPKDITIMTNGNVLVADFLNNRFQQFTAEGEFINQWGTKGTAENQFNQAYSIAAAPNGNIYVVDRGNNRIQQFASIAKNTLAHPYKAVILAGGGKTIAGRTNAIWDGTWRVAYKAYRALSRQAFVSHEEIKFLSAGNIQQDLDNNGLFDDLETATKASLANAISNWATNAEDVVIFLANHGGPGTFRINNKEILTAQELDTWITQLEQKIPGKVTVVIESCNSASFFNPVSRPGRYLFASAQSNQPAVISNQGFSAFSYFFWSEIATGAPVKDAFRGARQAMSNILINNIPSNAQADTNGDRIFNKQDLDLLGNYCLGHCNQTAADAPIIRPLNPKTQTVSDNTPLPVTITIDHTQPINSAWMLVHRPDNITIDPNQPLKFESIPLSCNNTNLIETQCQGNYAHFDKQGEYRFSFYAKDEQGEISSPEIFTVTQLLGKAVHPVEYDESRVTLNIRDVEVDGIHYQAALEIQNDLFVLVSHSLAPQLHSPAAHFDPASGLLTIPHALAFGVDYQATFRHLDNFVFRLESASPKNNP